MTAFGPGNGLLGLAIFGAAGHLALGLALVVITVLNRAACAIAANPTRYFPKEYCASCRSNRVESSQGINLNIA